MKKIKEVVIGIGLAAGLVFTVYFFFIKECNIIIPPGANEKRCKCLGKVVNLRLLLGDERAMELPKTEHCVGVVVKRL